MNAVSAQSADHDNPQRAGGRAGESQALDFTAPLEVRYLPGILRELAVLIGLTATLRLVKAYGGTRLYVPRHFSPSHPLAALISPANLVKLVEAYDGDCFDIPRAQIAVKAARDKQIRAERLGGTTHARLALKHQLTERQIRNIVGPDSVAEAERQRRQPQLF